MFFFPKYWLRVLYNLPSLKIGSLIFRKKHFGQLSMTVPIPRLANPRLAKTKHCWTRNFPHGTTFKSSAGLLQLMIPATELQNINPGGIDSP
jgi:hypothetical protein